MTPSGIQCPECRHLMNWLVPPEVQVIEDGVELEIGALLCTHCECCYKF